MRVVIDAVGIKSGGGATVLLETLSAGCRLARITRITLLASPAALRQFTIPPSEKLSVVDVQKADSGPGRIWWILHGVGQQLRGLEFDAFIGFTGISGTRQAVSLVFVQQSLPYSKVFTSLEFEDFLSQLTPKRFELLRIASKGRYSIADLASAAHRNPSAVSRDVSKLSALGLLKVESVSNEGHGRKKIVMPVASTLSIHASIAAT